MNSFLLPAWTLFVREIVRFYRDRSRVIGSLAPPVLFWLFIGFGTRGSFRMAGSSGVGYLEYLFCGVAVMIVLFTAIFSTISIIEDRKEGFLQSVLVAPVSRGSIVMGKVLGGSVIAFIQGLLFVALAPTMGIHIGLIQAALLAIVLFLIACALTGLGYIIAWKLQSTQGFHSVMNLLLMPMWLLSGSIFPVNGAARALQWLMRINPLTYGVGAFQRVLFGQGAPGQPAPFRVCLAVLVAFSAVMFAIAWAMTVRRSRAEAV